MNIYANVTRNYNGHLSLLDAAQKLPQVTLNYDFVCGDKAGIWFGDPIREIKGVVTPMPQEVRELYAPVVRTDSADPELLFNAVKTSIDSSWREDAFHLVFHSSGYDSRIISKAIGALALEHGAGWLGQGLLFLCNRWEARSFYDIMVAEGWDRKYFAAIDGGWEDEHFAEPAYDIWRNAPCPIPGNLWRYLPLWAIEKGLMPNCGIQAYTGLWANETWNAFLEEPNSWQRRVNNHYGYNVMAALPVLAQWVEYPLADVEVLKLLRQILSPIKGDALRKLVANSICPEAKNIRGSKSNDRNHPISPRLQGELAEYYRGTYLGGHIPFVSPETSEFSPHWGRWSLALLVDKLIDGGTHVI